MIGENKASTQVGLTPVGLTPEGLIEAGPYRVGRLFSYFLLCLITLVALTACGGSGSPTTSVPKTDPNSPAPVIAIKIDPSKGEFNILSQQLSTQQIEDIQIGNDNFKLDNFDVSFLAGNRIQVSADFVNSPRFAGGSKESKELILPIRFEQDARTTAGISSLVLPEITEQSFGQASILPHGRVSGLDFEIQHFGEPFNYYVDAYSSKVEVLQDCSSQQVGTYTIRSTADALKLKDCVVLDANITIDGSNGSIDLSALDNLRALDGDLLIRDLKLSTNASPFAGLEGIAGELRLFDVSGDVRGFDKLKDVTGKIEIANSEGKTLGGFSTLEIANELVIGNNTYGGFDSSFFKALEYVEVLEISKNPNLVNLSSLTALESVSRLIINDNSSKEGLSSLVGLENLLSVGKLEITNNAALKSLTALEKLESVYESTISNNGNLDCSLKVQPSGQPAYLPKFLPASASTGNQVNCAVAPKGDFEFSKQSSIDSFKGIEVIDGNVRIDFGKSAVTNLNALNSLKEIRGSLEIRGAVPLLNSSVLNGLGNLKLIDGDFSIRMVEGKVNLAPLANLQQITGTLRVFSGLEGDVFKELFSKFEIQASSPNQLRPNQSFLGGLHIQGCAEGTNAENCKEQLKNIKHPKINKGSFIGGLRNLSELTLIGTNYETVEFNFLSDVGSLTLKSNPNLTGLIRLNGITDTINIGTGIISSNPNFDCIQSKLNISTGQSEGNKVNCNSALAQNFVISSAANLENLKDVSVLEGDLTIQVAPDSKITSLAQLSKLKEIRGDLIIGARPDQVSLAPTNRGLNSLAGLEALELVGGQIIIKRNADLSSIAQLTALKQVNGFSDISENSKLDCRTTPVPAFLPANFSQGNLFNCATKNEPYSILPEQSEISVERNGTDLIDINIGDRVAGFSELINLSLDANPAIESFSFNPKPTQTQAELEFKVSATAPAGSTNLVIRGESAVTKAEVTATIKLNVVANAPVIRSSRLKDNGTSRQVRQGGLVSLELDGQNLINISSMKLTNNSTIDISGSLSVDVTNKLPTLLFTIPYAALGTVSLELTTDAGTFSFPNEKVEITAITARAGATKEPDFTQGTPDRPYHTARNALSRARSGSTVRLLNSRFNADSGEAFPLSIPSGVSVEGESRDGVIIEGPATNSKTATVQFLEKAAGGFGGASLTQVTIVGGAEGLNLNATGGTFSLENVIVRDSGLGLSVEGSALVDARNLTIKQIQGYGIWVNSTKSASLNIRDSQVSEASSGIVITTGAGNFDMRNTQVTNNNYFGVHIQTSGTVSIADSSVSNNGLTGITIPSATGTATFTNVKAENNTGNGVEIFKGNLSMTGQLSGNTQNQFLDERPARASADGAVVNLVGTVISGSSCMEGVVTGPHDSGGLKIKNANNRVNCSFEAF